MNTALSIFGGLAVFVTIAYLIVRK